MRSTSTSTTRPPSMAQACSSERARRAPNSSDVDQSPACSWSATFASSTCSTPRPRSTTSSWVRAPKPRATGNCSTGVPIPRADAARHGVDGDAHQDGGTAGSHELTARSTSGSATVLFGQRPRGGPDEGLEPPLRRLSSRRRRCSTFARNLVCILAGRKMVRDAHRGRARRATSWMHAVRTPAQGTQPAI